MSEKKFNNDNPTDLNENLEELVRSLEEKIIVQRRELMEKGDEILEFEKKIVSIEKETQERLSKSDDILSQMKFIQDKTDLLLRQERMAYQEKSTLQYFELLDVNRKLSELNEVNENLAHQINQITMQLEAEVSKVNMVKQAYSGVFDAFIVNFSKLYSVLGLPKIILSSPTVDENTKINHIFEFFPEILNVLQKMKAKERTRTLEKQQIVSGE